jgi:hypothetical protein
MKHCCDNFALYCSFDKRAAPNIRIIKCDEVIKSRPLMLLGKLIKVAKETLQMQTPSPYRFFITMGYTGAFTPTMPALNICFCPFCGVNLFDYYTNNQADELVHEFQATDGKCYPKQ